MSDWTKADRARGAAHLSDLAGIALRSGPFGRGMVILEQASDVLTGFLPEEDYREGLMAAGVPVDTFDAAVAAILAGRHPDTSLPGRLTKMRENAQCVADLGLPVDRSGRPDAFASALALLGCKVTP